MHGKIKWHLYRSHALEPLYIAPLIMGLFSSLHCVGMCGGIMGALTYSLPTETREQRPRLLGFLALYNSGRILSYTLAGSLIGTMGNQLYTTLSPETGYLLLQSTAAILMVSVGLYIAGWFPKYAYIERIGLPVWRWLEPIGRRLLPVSTPFQALLYGLVWGWLPCGLVYSALLLTVTAGDAVQGGLYMLAFGLGTLPAILGVGIFTEKVVRFTRRPRIRQLAGLTLIALALAGLLFADQLHQLLPQSDQQPLMCNDEQLRIDIDR